MLFHLWLLALGYISSVGAYALSKTDGVNCKDAETSSDFAELQKYAHLASVAYCIEKGLTLGLVGEQGDKCPSSACSHKETKALEIVRRFEFTGLFEVGSGIIAVDESSKSIYLAFMGTSTYQDWLNNLSAMPVLYRPLVVTSDDFKAVDNRDCVNCRVHKGINSFLKLNGAIVLKEVLKVKKELPDYRLVVTGHSLGAALATLAGIELRLLGFETLVVTLAGPKVGERNFAKFVDELFDTSNVTKRIDEEKSFDHIGTALVRMVHLHDVVPYLPPTRFFKHSGYDAEVKVTLKTSPSII
ncbi:hypothetical protein OXX79_007568 [Metschnikowia pulcherrima]|nr:hypothetical protein OY671_005795 [Metschnikowia pulcherrima]